MPSRLHVSPVEHTHVDLVVDLTRGRSRAGEITVWIPSQHLERSFGCSTMTRTYRLECLNEGLEVCASMLAEACEGAWRKEEIKFNC
jgi:hypothetical protein